MQRTPESWMMKIAAVTVLTACFGTACSVAGPHQPLPLPQAQSLRVAMGSVFKLPVGGSAQIEGTALQVGFDAVTSDSRCPKGEQCVWAGDAAVRVWLQDGAQPRLLLTLHLSTDPGPIGRALGHQVRLLRLEPDPVSGKPIAPAAYVATLTLTTGAAANAGAPSDR
jgi:hypothetical protein